MSTVATTIKMRASRWSGASFRWNRAVGLLAFLVVAATMSMGVAPVANAAQTYFAGQTYFAIGKHVCREPRRAGHVRCFAMRRVEVPRGTPGARAFKPAAGASRSDSIGPAGGLTPSALVTAYGLPATGGADQIVAIVDAYHDPNIEADLGVFSTQYGLAACTIANGCLTVVNQNGNTSPPPPNDTTGWSVETSLDVEAVHAICQQCKILLVEANSSDDANLIAAVNTAVVLGATVVSNSYGGPESSEPAWEAAFDHPGVVVVASTGDDGYYDYDKWDKAAATSVADSPASLPTVVAVGGTSLYLGQTGARQSETVWNDNGFQDYFERLTGDELGATGGGCSTVYMAQPWQIHTPGWGTTGCGSMRLAADVAAVGDYLTALDTYHSYDCGSPCDSLGWNTIGGTSLSAPLIAAIFALAGGANGIDYPALTLYGHLGQAYDVTVGGNGWCYGVGAASCADPNQYGYGVLDCAYTADGGVAVGNRACAALVGFDGPTGVGTPNGLTIFEKTGPTATISGPKTVASGAAGTWTATATDPFPHGVARRYSWRWDDGSRPEVTTTPTATHSFAAAGTYRVLVTVKDNYGVTGRPAVHPVRVKAKKISSR